MKVLNPYLQILDNEYVNCKEKMNILCNNGHVFRRNWIDLLRNCKCPECSKLEYIGSYNFTNAEINKNKWINKAAIVYIVKLFDKKESYFKIGITNLSVRKRILYRVPYEYELLYEIKTNMYDATYIEYELHCFHKKFQYIPKKNFDGWTECFEMIDDDIIKRYINYYNYNNRFEFNRHHLIIDNQNYNLNVLQLDELKLLLVRLNMYLISAKDLGIKLEIAGYNIDEWITDIKSKIEIFEHKKKESELKTLEAKLDKMLSDEKKTELELDEIAALLG